MSAPLSLAPAWADRLERPCLLLDPARMYGNLARMQERARAWGCPLRVHMKTPQSVPLAEQFRARGVDRIAVSSLVMAREFHRAGWQDQLLAMPLNPNWVPGLLELNHTASVAALVSDEGVLESLAGLHGDCRLPVWVELDAGYGRSGIPWDSTEELARVVHRLSRLRGVEVRGLLYHAGDSYSARGVAGVAQVAAMARERMLECRRRLVEQGAGPLALSFGDTPCCSLGSGLEVFDELRPGNFLFHDLMQLDIGSCGEDGLALAVLCPVLCVRPAEGRAVLHGGAVHLSKEGLPAREGQPTAYTFGQLVEADSRGLGRRLEHTRIVRLSQEHAVLEAPRDLLDRLTPGMAVAVLPVHSCLAADLHREYRTPDGGRMEKFCCL